MHASARHALPILVAALLLALTPGRAHAAGLIYSGPGWRIATEDGIHSLSPRQYLFTFADTASRTRLTPYAQAVAEQLTAVTGTTFTVTTTIETPPAVGSCPAEHHMILGVKYRPTGAQGMSRAWNCYTNRPGQPDYHAAWGGWTWIDSEYWYANWFSTNATVNTARIKNAITHEIGHLVGLAHPNTDVDGDGLVEDYECVRTTYGYLPVMCAPGLGGYDTADGGGDFTSKDTPGLRQLVANYGLG
ncbi:MULTISPECIES: hypothetical protein [Streptomyces]|uniref:Peptidase M10 metallopeptidase domain-containing protein n=2 Tax=Streptomyces TaxID=1883 RepID=A0A2U9NZ89_STRAS|nr:hypothetical protein [Streptomyces actuosus]AWT42543.1 hypothetical protein DMT42_09595 [Streptomyces actuosus]MBM4819745.1 hypothetical protein [Streptomyces actuosus]